MPVSMLEQVAKQNQAMRAGANSAILMSGQVPITGGSQKGRPSAMAPVGLEGYGIGGKKISPTVNMALSYPDLEEKDKRRGSIGGGGSAAEALGTSAEERHEGSIK